MHISMKSDIACVSYNVDFLFYSWEIDITFCTIYTLTSRIMWAVFPYTIISICLLGLFNRAMSIFVSNKVSIEVEDGDGGIPLELQAANFPSQDSKSFNNSAKSVEMEELEDMREGFSALQKTLLVFIWMSSLIYGLISNVILTKERDVKCSVRSDLEITFNLVSIIVVIAVPVVCIIFWLVAHLLLSVCSCVKKLIFSNTRRSTGRNQKHLQHYNKTSSLWLEIIIIFCFALVFVTVYPTSMYITETYFATTKTIFPFMLIKYCVGSLQLIISPLCVLLIKRDIRKGVSLSYTKGSTQNDETEITFEELQEHLGIGVNVNN